MPELVGVLEIEPQTLWRESAAGSRHLRVDPQALRRARDLPGTKILHGIGFPVGGSLPPGRSQLEPLQATAEALRPAWISEHLSFNRARGVTNTGFLLPPRQTRAGAAAAAAAIQSMAGALSLPFAVETGVNYLRPRADEMDDGAFTASVIAAAGCGLVLDLHNLWANERNGRQPVMEFLRALPLERVWEIHLAGGSERDGYWLDSHSGAVPDPVLDLACRIVPQLPNLRAVIFELFPEYLPVVGLDLVRRQLDQLHARLAPLRDASPAWTAPVPAPPQPAAAPLERREAGPTVHEWEDELAALAIGRSVDSELAADPGVALMRGLVDEFRASMVAGVLQLTLRLLLLHLGGAAVEALLHRYARAHPPERFASSEAAGFAAYLAAQALDVPYLHDVLAFESAVLATLLDERPRVVAFAHDPLMILRALAEARRPSDPPAGAFEIEVTPRGGTAAAAAPLPFITAPAA